jgi:hypothetical protein
MQNIVDSAYVTLAEELDRLELGDRVADWTSAFLHTDMAVFALVQS